MKNNFRKKNQIQKIEDISTKPNFWCVQCGMASFDLPFLSQTAGKTVFDKCPICHETTMVDTKLLEEPILWDIVSLIFCKTFTLIWISHVFFAAINWYWLNLILQYHFLDIIIMIFGLYEYFFTFLPERQHEHLREIYMHVFCDLVKRFKTEEIFTMKLRLPPETPEFVRDAIPLWQRKKKFCIV